MTKREMIKMLNNYHKNKVCINLKSLMRTIRNDKINSEIYKVNKLYVHLIYGKRKAEKVYEDMNNIEVRIITKLLIYSYSSEFVYLEFIKANISLLILIDTINTLSLRVVLCCFFILL